MSGPRVFFFGRTFDFEFCQQWQYACATTILNNLRKVWTLPPYSHTAIVHCVAGIPTISDIVYHRFCKFLSRGLSSSSELVSKIFHESSLLAYTSTGYNMLYGKQPQEALYTFCLRYRHVH